MSPTEFDTKLTELRTIEQRMKHCTGKTPITQVVADQNRAQLLYGQLAAAISEFKSNDKNSIGTIASNA